MVLLHTRTRVGTYRLFYSVSTRVHEPGKRSRLPAEVQQTRAADAWLTESRRQLQWLCVLYHYVRVLCVSCVRAWVCVCVFVCVFLRLDCACLCVCVKAREAQVGRRRRTAAAISYAFILLLFQEETVPALPGKWFQAAFLRRTPKNVFDRSPPMVLYYKLTHTVRHICTCTVYMWNMRRSSHYTNMGVGVLYKGTPKNIVKILDILKF